MPTKFYLNKIFSITIILLSSFFSLAAYSITLTEAIIHTVDTNPEILIGINRFRASNESVNMEKAGLLPTVDFSASYGISKSNNSGDITDSGGNNSYKDSSSLRTFNSGISVQKKLFDGHETKYRLDNAKHKKNYQSIVVKETVLDVTLRVVETYLKVLRSQQMVELARENLAVHDEIYSQTSEKAKNGLARLSDLEQVRSRRSKASSNLVSAISSISNARTEFFNLSNLKPKSFVMPKLDSSVLPVTLEEALLNASKANPTIRASSIDVLAREAFANSINSSDLPDVDFSLNQNWGFTSGSSKQREDGSVTTRNPSNDDALGVMLNFTYNLYDGGVNKARKREAFFQIEEARAVRDLKIRSVMKDVRLAWDAYVYSAGKMNFLKDHLKASRTVSKGYQEQFQLGKRSLLDLLDVENELFRAQQDFITIVHDELFSRYRILKNTGSLLEQLNIKLPHTMKERLQYISGNNEHEGIDDLADATKASSRHLPDL